MSETQTQYATGATRTVDVLDATGATTGTVELPGHLFDVTANIPLIHQVVVAQLAAARQGTSKVKTRAEVSGGGTKPHRQKGTGRARQGSIRAPQYVGGGIVHGPTPRSYVQRTPKKMIAAALRGALSDRARDGRVHVISDLVAGDFPSTKSVLSALAAATSSPKVLVVIHRDEDLAWLSLRNAPAVHALAADQLNAYDVLVNDEVVFTAAALEAFIAGPVSGKSVKSVASSIEPGAFVEPSNEELAAEADGVVVDEADTVDEVDTEAIAEPVVAEEVLEPVEQELVEPTNAELAADADVEETK
jgi:large subunit ribosomal protein L4